MLGMLCISVEKENLALAKGRSFPFQFGLLFDPQTHTRFFLPFDSVPRFPHGLVLFIASLSTRIGPVLPREGYIVLELGSVPDFLHYPPI
jgi:hypothetical protein